MNKKLILTSMLAIAVAGPALAETFPQSGLMEENTTYDNAATYTNMGVYSGTATAEPQYDINSYDITAGEYLAANGITGTQCPAGSYCIGGNFTFSETNTQGLASCPDTYSLSAEGAKTEAECYRQCTYSDVAHSKENGTFIGTFYSNEINACEPVNDASCADGYHYKEALVNPLANVDASIAATSIRYKSISGTGSNSSDTTGLNNGDFEVSFSYGNITGKALCSTTNKKGSGNYPTGTPDESGRGLYCWCQIDGYTPVGGSKQSLSGAWVFHSYCHAATYCARDCAGDCAKALRGTGAFRRAALLGSVPASPAICEANDITINWGDGIEATSCKYDGDITTPAQGVEKTGYTFKGWKFNKNN